ncbi:MAG: hypothetical protein IPP91_19395 [Betaproteobacteria bacterium]|nr:hypothetical protein [Betaproteobacteria bacterium]
MNFKAITIVLCALSMSAAAAQFEQAQGFFAPEPYVAEAKGGHGVSRIERDSLGRPTRIINADGSTAGKINYDDNGRVRTIHGPKLSMQVYYASPVDRTPTTLVMNGRVLDVKHFEAHSAMLRERQGAKFLEQEDPELARMMMGDWMAGCAADVTCFASEGTDAASMGHAVERLVAWAGLMGIISAGTAFALFEGTVSTETLAAMVALFGTAGSVGFLVAVGGFYIGTMIYDSAGDAFWLYF